MFDDLRHAHYASERKFGIHLGNLAAQSGGQAVRIGSCANHKRERRHRALKKRLINFRVIAGSFGVGFHVGDNSDDLAPLWGAAAHIQANLFSKRLVTKQMALHKLFVYHDYGRRCSVIRLREAPAMQQGDGCGSEIVGAYQNIKRPESLVGRQFGLTFDLKSYSVRSGRGQVGSNCYDRGAGNLLEARNHILDKAGLLEGLFVSRVVKGYPGGEEMVGPEAQVLVGNQENSANEQPGSHQKKQSQRDLASDHHPPETAMGTALRGGPAFVFQISIDVGA